jgi:hypothetical protein
LSVFVAEVAELVPVVEPAEPETGVVAPTLICVSFQAA